MAYGFVVPAQAAFRKRQVVQCYRATHRMFHRVELSQSLREQIDGLISMALPLENQSHVG
jgi:hypothetical protein